MSIYSLFMPSVYVVLFKTYGKTGLSIKLFHIKMFFDFLYKFVPKIK